MIKAIPVEKHVVIIKVILLIHEPPVILKKEFWLPHFKQVVWDWQIEQSSILQNIFSHMFNPWNEVIVNPS